MYAYGVAIQLFSDRIFRAQNILLVAVGLWLVVGPVTDLATSIVIVRGLRSNIEPLQLVQETIAVFQDKEAIRAFLLSGKEIISDSDWDERYVDNLFLSRMCNLKFADNGIALAMSLDADKRAYLGDLEWQRTLSVYPRPVLKFLELDVDKDTVTQASGGDILLYLATGSPFALGSFRTGSFFANGYALLDWFYPIVISFLSVFVFVLADAQTSRNLSANVKSVSWVPTFNPLVISNYFSWFFFLSSQESLSAFALFILRGWLQSLVIYAVAYLSTISLLGSLRKGRF